MAKTNSTAGQGPTMNAKAKASAFRITRTGDIVPSSIDMMLKLTVDPSMKAALTAAGAKLTVEIDTAGTRVFLADARTSQILGGPEDLQRIGGIRAFVNRERKEAGALESGNTVNRVAYLASAYALAKDRGYQQMPLESSFTAAVKPVLATLEKLDQNELKLEENKNPSNREVAEIYLRTQFSRIRKAYLEYVLALVKGEVKKGYLSEVIFSNGVPEYMHAKLISNNLVIDKTQDINRVIFPADPSKGLTLTLKEWRSLDFVRTQGPILEASRIPLRLARNDAFLRSICRFEESVDLTDETNTSVALALKGKLFVTLHLEDTTYLTSAGAKVKTNGWKFPVVSMENPRGAVSALGLAVLRVYAANLQTVDLVRDYYGTICPDTIKVSEIAPTNNMYAQWEKSFSAEGFSDVHLDIIRGQSDLACRQKTVDWIAMELKLPASGPSKKLLSLAFGLTENGGDPNRRDSNNEVAWFNLPAVVTAGLQAVNLDGLDFRRELTPEEIPLSTRFKGDVFGKSKGKREARVGNSSLTPLTQNSKALVERVGRLSPYLATSVTNWLRGFSDPRLQTAAARLAIASFDELFMSEGLYSDDAESMIGLDFDQANWADQMEDEE